MEQELADKYVFDAAFYVGEMVRLSDPWLGYAIVAAPIATFVALAIYCQVQKIRFWPQGFYFQIMVPLFVFVMVPFVNVAEMNLHIKAMSILTFMQEEAEENGLALRQDYQDWLQQGQNKMLDVRGDVVDNMVDNIMSADQQGFVLDLARICLSDPEGSELIQYLEVYPANKYVARQLFRNYSQSVNYEAVSDDSRCELTNIWHLLDRT